VTTPDETSPTQEVVRIDAGGWGWTWAADTPGRLHQVGLGLDGADAPVEVDPVWYPDAHPTWGGPDPYRPPALRRGPPRHGCGSTGWSGSRRATTSSSP
jgi:hypothetical protein